MPIGGKLSGGIQRWKSPGEITRGNYLGEITGGRLPGNLPGEFTGEITCFSFFDGCKCPIIWRSDHFYNRKYSVHQCPSGLHLLTVCPFFTAISLSFSLSSLQVGQTP